MLHPIDLLQAIADTQAEGDDCVLATLTAVDGPSPRPIGSQMLIRADGSSVGMLSSSCIEQAIIGQALAALADNQPRQLRYGKGSSWFDLQLPSGSGIDVHLCVNPDATLIIDTLATLETRKTVRWLLDEQGQWYRTQRPSRDTHTQTFTPRWQLLAVGQGPIFTSLAAIAKPCDLAVHLYSPASEDLKIARPFAYKMQQLQHANDFICPPLDKFSAAVVLFHDHDWEAPILQAMLATQAKYIAALGSPKRHTQRLMELTRLGVKPKQLSRIKGPAGLNINAIAPAQIALSIVAEMVQTLNGRA